MLKCTICKRMKPRAEFNRKQGSPTGHQNVCKGCNKDSSARSNAKRRSELARARRLLKEASEILEGLSL